MSDAIHLLRGDTITIKDKTFTVAESVSFRSFADVDDFLAHSKEVYFNEYSPLWCICGGSKRRRKGLVRSI